MVNIKDKDDKIKIKCQNDRGSTSVNCQLQKYRKWRRLRIWRREDYKIEWNNGCNSKTKTLGCDNITPKVIKFMKEETKKEIRVLMSEVIKIKNILNYWNIGIILSIFKHGEICFLIHYFRHLLSPCGIQFLNPCCPLPLFKYYQILNRPMKIV